MRSPLQGGLLPAEAVAGPVVRIACDESGFSGTNLLHPGMPTITHASVDLSAAEAADLLVRLGAGSASRELKSGQFLRAGREDRFQEALRGRALVHVINKRFFLVTRIVDFLLYEPSYAAGTRLTQAQRPAAVALARVVRESPGLLPAFADLVRTKRRRPASETVQRFLAAAAPVVEVEPARVWALAARLDDDDREIPPPLEPLLPALAETVLSWSANEPARAGTGPWGSGDGSPHAGAVLSGSGNEPRPPTPVGVAPANGERRVLVTHDEQSALTADRLARLQRALAGADGVSPLAGFVMADSRDDPRIQVADLLAGVARRLGVEDSLLTPTSCGRADGHGGG
ncbi:hypothetical protein Aab01nite_15730 [Paractinoplanes abujensis]|uniref:DUF3800 domain-containing protein n=1 Tax=Paractinoplanes abujensis TaxID=882441 RepID=A0A7W7CP39_9ACTN|nr:hypothetical protein [Actinoplanes abujensis]MBB4690603.1 hypothetical protein [Actinoplanes abujensis]GID17983.1 hypothetical protein Aab01nite_15730 [Actinoplanes abujensis]